MRGKQTISTSSVAPPIADPQLNGVKKFAPCEKGNRVDHLATGTHRASSAREQGQSADGTSVLPKPSSWPRNSRSKPSVPVGPSGRKSATSTGQGGT
jgi:hypothetical protein